MEEGAINITVVEHDPKILKCVGMNDNTNGKLTLIKY